MRTNGSLARRLRVAVPIAVLAVVGLTMSASASASEYSGLFEYCPTSNPGVTKCMHSTTTGGQVAIGGKTIPLIGETVIQGGYKGSFDPEAPVSPFFGATNGETLSSDPLNVFKLGLIPIKASVELAGPPEGIGISELALITETGPMLTLPVKIHLENPLLGRNCYIGSDKEPIVWQLTVGTTSPPPPNQPITGAVGQIEFLAEGRILEVTGMRLVDNSWAVPAARGCGLAFHAAVDRLVNGLLGLPSRAGRNTAILDPVKTDIATAAAVRNGL